MTPAAPASSPDQARRLSWLREIDFLRFLEVYQMRSYRILIGAALPLLLSSAAHAQSDRLFRDAWFWGVKGGMTLFSTPAVQNRGVPSVGAEWLITRTRAGLLASYDQSFYTDVSTINDQTVGTNQRTVNIKGLRRATAIIVAFPWQQRAIRPYAGLGFSMMLIPSAVAQGSFQNQATRDTVASRVDDARSRGTVVAMTGLQLGLRRFNVFGQASAAPPSKSFMFRGSATYFLEGGIRYNFGSSIERPK